MARIVLVTPAAPGSTTTTPTTEIVEIPETPVAPGVSFNGSPAEMIQFLRDLGQLPPAPAPHIPPAPLTFWQQMGRLATEGYWGLVGLLTAILRTVGFGLTLALVYLILAWNGVVPAPNWDFLMDAAGIQQIEEAPPAPTRPSGPSLSDRLSGIEDQLGGIRTDVDGLKVQPAPVVEQVPPAPVVQEAPPAPAPESAKKGIQWPWKKKATP